MSIEDPDLRADALFAGIMRDLNILKWMMGIKLVLLVVVLALVMRLMQP